MSQSQAHAAQPAAQPAQGGAIKLTADDGRTLLVAKSAIAVVTLPAPLPQGAPLGTPAGEVYITLVSGQMLNAKLTDENKKALQAAGAVPADPKPAEHKPAA